MNKFLILKRMILAELLKCTALIVLNEIFMQYNYCFVTVNNTIENIKVNDKSLFKGISIFLGGGFV